MERLTDKNFRIGFDDSNKLPSYAVLYERLMEYENLEEQCRLLKLPHPLGDTLDSIPCNVVKLAEMEGEK